MPLAGQIAVVTGASKDIGKGIAIQLGKAGCTVYVTGKKPSHSEICRGNHPSKLEQVAQEIDECGGKGIAVYVDHSDMGDVRQFFERIDRENKGRLDILVNAFAAVKTLAKNLEMQKNFYETDPDIWDEVNNVGLRNHYYCSVYAARIMAKRRTGLIVMISSFGGLRYTYNIPYGVGRQANDRMADDMAQELRASNVTVVSLWPGFVKTEHVRRMTISSKILNIRTVRALEAGESVYYPGKAVVALAKDPNRLRKTGRILITADLGAEYGFKDVDGRDPPNFRSLSVQLRDLGYDHLASWIPCSIKIPGWLLWLSSNRL